MRKYFFLCIIGIWFFVSKAQSKSYLVTKDSPGVINKNTFSQVLIPGDTIFIDASRTTALFFENIEGSVEHPIVVQNKNGIVNINDSTSWAALQFKNCKYIKVSGTGLQTKKYGFKLAASSAGIAVTELSSHFIIENISISHQGFFGIQIKKDYHQNPPVPFPEFQNLVIHDCFITNVSVGMYIGETTSPGMEFKHVRIFNNIVYNTQREGIQLSNSNEDIEVHHNLVYITGRGHLAQQGNGIQIGDNTIGSYHHNIVLNSTEYGFIVFGSGDIDIRNNYISDNKGIFIDSRTVSIPGSEISIEENYFRNSKNNYVNTVFNKKNTIEINNNLWFSGDEFINDNISSAVKLSATNNRYQYFEPIVIENLIVSSESPAPFLEMGPQKNIGYSFNYRPVLESANYFIFDWNKKDTIKIQANTPDNDKISFALEDSLDFTFLVDNGNGSAEILINPVQEKGIYTSRIVAWDHSHKEKSRLNLQIAIKDPNNRPPTIENINELVCENLKANSHTIQINDPDNDVIKVYSKNFPEFLKFVKKDNSELNFTYTIECKPKFSDVGKYDSLLLIVDDGFGFSDSVYFNLVVNQSGLNNGTVLYRVNCGGPEVPDENLNWEDSFNKDLNYQKTEMHNTGSHFWSGANITAAPDDIFGPFCYNYIDHEDMKWEFTCPNANYRVNLYFTERQMDIDNTGESVFNVRVNNIPFLENFNIYQTNGLAAQQKSIDLTVSNKKIEIDFEQIQGIPKINGIEIIFMDYGNNPPVATDIFGNGQTDGVTNTVIYPNPTKSEIQIINRSNKIFNKIEVLNITGKILISEKPDFFKKKQCLQLNRLNSGIYYIRLSEPESNSEVHKIILLK